MINLKSVVRHVKAGSTKAKIVAKKMVKMMKKKKEN